LLHQPQLFLSGLGREEVQLDADCTNQFDESISVHRFSEEAYSTTLQIKLLRTCRRLSRNDDDGDGEVVAFQMLQKTETTHFPHLDIRDYAAGLGKGAG